MRETQAELDVEYVGPLARSQKMATVDGIVRWLGTLAQMAQFPGGENVLDAPDYDEIADYTANILGVPAKLTTDMKDRKDKRKQRDDMRKQQMAAEQAKNMGSALQSAGAGVASLGDAGINLAGEAPLTQGNLQ